MGLPPGGAKPVWTDRHGEFGDSWMRLRPRDTLQRERSQ